MRIRSILITLTAAIVAIPAIVLGVDEIVRWTPASSTTSDRVAAATDLDAYLAAREDSVAG